MLQALMLSSGSGESKIFIIKPDSQPKCEASFPQFSFPSPSVFNNAQTYIYKGDKKELDGVQRVHFT